MAERRADLPEEGFFRNKDTDHKGGSGAPLRPAGRKGSAGKNMKEIVETKQAPGAIGPYSQAIRINNLLYTSGQLPVNPQTGDMPASVEEQAEQSLENLKAVVEAGGSSMGAVLKTTVFIKDMNDFGRINEVYAKYFDAPYPARSCVEVARLPKDALVEIECVAAVD